MNNLDWNKLNIEKRKMEELERIADSLEKLVKILSQEEDKSVALTNNIKRLESQIASGDET